jgi:hypothetical protein
LDHGSHRAIQNQDSLEEEEFNWVCHQLGLPFV